MGQCNWCSYQDIKKRFKGTDIRVLTRDEKGFSLGGVNVYAVPRGEKLDRAKHYIAWFMQLPERCCC